MDGSKMMRWLVIASLVIAFAFASTPTTRLCYHCINTDRHLSPTIRRQLGNQRDIFYWSIEAVNPNCHRAGPIYSDEFEAQICPTSAPCIALSTNIANVNFTIRGCMTRILRHPLLVDNQLQHLMTTADDSCLLIRSKPLYADEKSINYVLCMCKDEYCNGQAQHAYIDYEPTERFTELRLQQIVNDDNDEQLATERLVPVVVALASRTIIGGNWYQLLLMLSTFVLRRGQIG